MLQTFLNNSVFCIRYIPRPCPPTGTGSGTLPNPFPPIHHDITEHVVPTRRHGTRRPSFRRAPVNRPSFTNVPQAAGTPASWLPCLGNFHCKVTRRQPRCKGFQKIFLFSPWNKKVYFPNLPLPWVADDELSKAVKIFPILSHGEAELRGKHINAASQRPETNPKGMGS